MEWRDCSKNRINSATRQGTATSSRMSCVQTMSICCVRETFTVRVSIRRTNKFIVALPSVNHLWTNSNSSSKQHLFFNQEPTCYWPSRTINMRHYDRTIKHGQHEVLNDNTLMQLKSSTGRIPSDGRFTVNMFLKLLCGAGPISLCKTLFLRVCKLLTRVCKLVTWVCKLVTWVCKSVTPWKIKCSCEPRSARTELNLWVGTNRPSFCPN